MVDDNILRHICQAIIGFQLEDKIRMPYHEFDNEKVRYEHRFSAFNVSMTPPFVQYSEFYDTSTRLKEAGVDFLYFSASKLYHQARTLLESIPNPDQEVRYFFKEEIGRVRFSMNYSQFFFLRQINALLKVAKTNFVVLKVLASGHKRGREHALDFDFSAHHNFPLFKLA